jgi:hypothetical protein
MNVYHCMIELKDGARALAFAAAVDAWMSYLMTQGLISDWRLMRRKFRLASGAHTDFLLEINVGGLADLDAAFTALSTPDEAAERRYDQMHQMISSIDVGLYRPFPDPAQRERIALI